MDKAPGAGGRAPTKPGLRSRVLRVLAVLLTGFVLLEVNYPQLSPQSQLAIFAGLGLAAGFLYYPAARRFADHPLARGVDAVLALCTVAVFGYVVVQTEPSMKSWWIDGRALGERAGAEAGLDYVVGTIGLLLVLELTRRCVGLALPILATLFLLYARFGQAFPSFLFPHRGYGLERIVSQTFLHSQGVFGIALKVMFTYVFLFVVFGALLEATGAIGAIIAGAQRLFRNARGGPAKVSVLSSGLMGSLSGSAVANTATTGTFTIPLMRSAGFPPHIAAGVEAAASSGGALVPPVMGAGAYMMLEIVTPPVTYLEIVRAAIVPALLYYLSLFLIVHFTSRRLALGSVSVDEPSAELPLEEGRQGGLWAGAVFFAGLASLLVFLLLGYTVFRAVTLAMIVVLVMSALNKNTRIGPAALVTALEKSARAGLPLIGAASCVGIVIGVVTLTGIGTRLPSVILPLAQDNLPLALVLIMVSSIILGMGLPSAVCYLLMATLIGPVLGDLGVVPLAAHLFIFYFGMMAMVTPPVALAAYAAGSIAGTNIMRAGFAAFRFALAGFTLPYLFVLRPELLLLSPDGGSPSAAKVAMAILIAALGILALASGIADCLRRPTTVGERVALFLAAFLLLFPGTGGNWIAPANVVGGLVLAGVLLWQGRGRRDGEEEASG